MSVDNARILTELKKAESLALQMLAVQERAQDFHECTPGREDLCDDLDQIGAVVDEYLLPAIRSAIASVGKLLRTTG